MTSDAGSTVSDGASPDGLPPLRDVIRTHGLDARKSLGQNFILDLNLTRRIAREAGPLEGVTVVEIGPGPGGLTRGLLLEGASRILAVERDDRCLPALGEISKRWPGRLEIIAADALDIDWAAELARRGISGPVRIAANLPYGVASRLLVGWLETAPWPPWFERMTLMFQREVAERIAASPGTKAYGRLAVISQWRCQVRIAMTLGPKAFTPPPKVDSAVVDLEPRASPYPACDVRLLGRITGAAFGQRRKMLRSSLRAAYAEPDRLLEQANIAGDRRGETLSVEEFATLALALGRLSD